MKENCCVKHALDGHLSKQLCTRCSCVHSACHGSLLLWKFYVLQVQVHIQYYNIHVDIYMREYTNNILLREKLRNCALENIVIQAWWPQRALQMASSER